MTYNDTFDKPALSTTRGRARTNLPGSAAVDLSELAGILWFRRKWIINTTMILVGLAMAYALFIPSKYIASTRVLIDPRGLKVIEKEVTPQGRSADANVTIVESQMHVMISDNVLKKVIKRENLATDPEFGLKRGLLSTLSNDLLWLAGFDIQPSDPDRKALQLLWKAVGTERVTGSYIVDLSVKTKYPKKSARLANAITSAYIDLEFLTRAKQKAKASASLSKRLDELQSQVRIAEGRVEKYKVKHNIVIVDAEGKLTNQQQLVELSTKFVTARELTAKAQARLEQITKLHKNHARPDAIAEAIESKTIQGLRLLLAQAIEKENSLASQLKATHPSHQYYSAKVVSLRSQIDAELDRIAESAKITLDRMQANQQKIKIELDKIKSTSQTTNQALVELRELSRKAGASRSVYEAYLKRVKEIDEQQDVDSTNARIISPAVAPQNPAGASLPVLLVLALGAGFALGSILAFSRETFSPTLHNARQLSKTTGQPVLAVIPPLPEGRVIKLGGKNGAGHVASWLRDDSDKLSAFVIENPYSEAANTIQQVTAELRRNARREGPQTVLVTALGAGEGKSTVALNLALAASVQNERVLLIDSDRSKRHLTQLLARDAMYGFVDVVNDRAGLRDTLRPQPDGMFNFLPASARNGSHFDPLDPEQLRHYLAEKLDEFDLIVIDGGLMEVDHDLRVFAGAVDDIVLVAQLDKTCVNDIPDALEFLGPFEHKSSGFIVMSG